MIASVFAITHIDGWGSQPVAASGSRPTFPQFLRYGCRLLALTSGQAFALIGIWSFPVDIARHVLIGAQFAVGAVVLVRLAAGRNSKAAATIGARVAAVAALIFGNIALYFLNEAFPSPWLWWCNLFLFILLFCGSGLTSALTDQKQLTRGGFFFLMCVLAVSLPSLGTMAAGLAGKITVWIVAFSPTFLHVLSLIIERKVGDYIMMHCEYTSETQWLLAAVFRLCVELARFNTALEVLLLSLLSDYGFWLLVLHLVQTFVLDIIAMQTCCICRDVDSLSESLPTRTPSSSGDREALFTAGEILLRAHTHPWAYRSRAVMFPMEASLLFAHVCLLVYAGMPVGVKQTSWLVGLVLIAVGSWSRELLTQTLVQWSQSIVPRIPWSRLPSHLVCVMASVGLSLSIFSQVSMLWLFYAHHWAACFFRPVDRTDSEPSPSAGDVVRIVATILINVAALAFVLQSFLSWTAWSERMRQQLTAHRPKSPRKSKDKNKVMVVVPTSSDEITYAPTKEESKDSIFKGFSNKVVDINADLPVKETSVRSVKSVKSTHTNFMNPEEDDVMNSQELSNISAHGEQEDVEQSFSQTWERTLHSLWEIERRESKMRGETPEPDPDSPIRAPPGAIQEEEEDWTGAVRIESKDMHFFAADLLQKLGASEVASNPRSACQSRNSQRTPSRSRSNSTDCKDLLTEVLAEMPSDTACTPTPPNGLVFPEPLPDTLHREPPRSIAVEAVPAAVAGTPQEQAETCTSEEFNELLQSFTTPRASLEQESKGQKGFSMQQAPGSDLSARVDQVAPGDEMEGFLSKTVSSDEIARIMNSLQQEQPTAEASSATSSATASASIAPVNRLDASDSRAATAGHEGNAGISSWLLGGAEIESTKVDPVLEEAARIGSKEAQKAPEAEAVQLEAQCEEEATKQKEEAAAQKAAVEAAAKQVAEEDAARRAAEEEAAKKRAEEEAARKTAEEKAARKAAEEAAAQKAAEEAAAKKAAEEAEATRKADEEAARKAAEEAAAKKAAEEEAARKAAEEAARAAAAKKAAEDALVAALVIGSRDELEQLLSDAQAHGVSDAVVGQGERRLSEIIDEENRANAQIALHEACESGRPEELRAAIDRAKELGVSEIEVSRATAKLNEILQKIARREAAQRQLWDALSPPIALPTASWIRKLEDAVLGAQSTGVAHTEIVAAEGKLKELRAQHRREVAVQAMSEALNALDIAKTRAALEEARAAEVDDAEVVRVEDALKILVEEYELAHNKEKLLLRQVENAMAATNVASHHKASADVRPMLSEVGVIGALRRAIDDARKTRLVRKGEVQKAEAVLIEVTADLKRILADKEEEEKRVACDKLRAAMEKARRTKPLAQPVLDLLRKEITAAREFNADPREAEALHASLVAENAKLKQQADDAVKRAISAKDAEAIKNALKQCRELLMQETVSKAIEELHAVVAADIDAARQAAREERVARATLIEGLIAVLRVNGDLQLRQLHNNLQDLKGALRVFCRVRPLNKRETDRGDTVAVTVNDLFSMNIETNSGPQTFTYDAILGPDSSQAEVYSECRSLVQSALDGYNVTIFSYGQTGAGKTWTLYGSGKEPGISPRTCDEVFRMVARESSRFDFMVTASMVELYLNDVRDLLCRSKEPPKLEFRSVKQPDGSLAVRLEGATEIKVESSENLAQVVMQGLSQRKVKATNMNADSSRSHLMLLIAITMVDKSTGRKRAGKITIVDLAGSERLSKSGVTGEGQREAIEINKSLTALGDVMMAFTSHHKIIPYRNHKLTQLMQDSLGGSAKTLMFVNVSPSSSNVDETVNALKYASRARCIENDVKKH